MVGRTQLARTTWASHGRNGKAAARALTWEIVRRLPTWLAVVAVVSCAAIERAEAKSECAAAYDPMSDRPAMATIMTGRHVTEAPDTLRDLRLTLNIPAYRLDLMERDSVLQSYTVSIGQPKYPTALGNFAIDYLVWNPHWIPPPSEWAKAEKPHVPGPSNPMGRVKLHITELVFLHGTSLEESLGHAESHSCIRMANSDAVALATLLLRRAAPNLAAASLDSLVADTTLTRMITLQHFVPIDVRYDRVEVGHRELTIYPDVYRRVPDERAFVSAVAAIEQAGIDADRVDARLLHDLIHRSRSGALSVAIDSLIGSVPSASARWRHRPQDGHQVRDYDGRTPQLERERHVVGAASCSQRSRWAFAASCLESARAGMRTSSGSTAVSRRECLTANG